MTRNNKQRESFDRLVCHWQGTTNSLSRSIVLFARNVSHWLCLVAKLCSFPPTLWPTHIETLGNPQTNDNNDQTNSLSRSVALFIKTWNTNSLSRPIICLCVIAAKTFVLLRAFWIICEERKPCSRSTHATQGWKPTGAVKKPSGHGAGKKQQRSQLRPSMVGSHPQKNWKSLLNVEHVL